MRPQRRAPRVSFRSWRVAGIAGLTWLAAAASPALPFWTAHAAEAPDPPPLTAPPAPAWPAGPQPVTIRSQSGQFVVRGLPQPLPSATVSTSALAYLRLDPNLTAVSLERIRQALQAELGWPNRWQGMISVTTHPVQEENARVTITTLRFPNGWGYRIAFPEIVDKDRFVTAAVKTILMEYANRRATAREAEMPLWLSEGLTAELMARLLPVLALEPATELGGRHQNPDALSDARHRLRERDPFSFDDLCMPAELAEADAAHYRACAQVFVHELLRLREGRAGLRRMLEKLPDNLNWQTTFLESFAPTFRSLLDADRWYSLAVTGTQARDLAALLSAPSTLEQLDSILSTVVEIRTAASELPIRTDMNLQRLVTEWDYPRQHQLLLEKIGKLRSLHGRAFPGVAGLVASYLEGIIAYVGPKNLSMPTRPKAVAKLRPMGDARSLVEQLNRLDERRAELSVKPPATPDVPAGASPSP